MDALTAAEFTERQRQRLAKDGLALPDGSFPIRNKTDLRNAITASADAEFPSEVRRHIEKRARALGAKSLLPEDWLEESAATASAQVAGLHVDDIVIRPRVTYEVVRVQPEYNMTASMQEQEEENQEEDNERYAEELCPSCGVTGSSKDGICAACGGAKHMTASAAGLAPLKPPRDWFYVEEPDEPTPLTVTADGRIFGHAAIWGSCHTGFPGRCTQPPPSPSGYSFFHLGQVETEEGEMVDVGRITMGTGHASLTASREQAAAHYDNTGMVAGFVRAQDGEHGIWVCGAARSDAPAEKIASLRAAAVSGDWRRPRPGQPMEMIGLLAVNVPGFPVPRAQAALAASAFGESIDALLAAGINAVTEEEAEAQLEVLLSLLDGSIDERIYSPAEKLMGGMTAALPFDESKHPRAPQGSRIGGRFIAVSSGKGQYQVLDKDTGETTAVKATSLRDAEVKVAQGVAKKETAALPTPIPEERFRSQLESRAKGIQSDIAGDFPDLDTGYETYITTNPANNRLVGLVYMGDAGHWFFDDLEGEVEMAAGSYDDLSWPVGFFAPSEKLMAQTAAAWDESKHPRNKATGRDGKRANSDGGKFAKSAQGAVATQDEKIADEMAEDVIEVRSIKAGDYFLSDGVLYERRAGEEFSGEINVRRMQVNNMEEGYNTTLSADEKVEPLRRDLVRIDEDTGLAEVVQRPEDGE